MSDKGPDLQHRMWSVAVALVAIGYGASLVQRYLGPLLPTLIALVALGIIFRLIFRGRR